MEFDFSLNAVSANNSKPRGPRYASDDGIAYSLSADEILFQSRRSGENHVMTRDVFMAMSQTRPFRTLDEHVQAIAAAQPALAKQGGAIRQVLEALIARGIMLSEQDLIAGFREEGSPTEAPFAGLVIRSCDRPGKLELLLSSLADDTRFQQQAIAVSVVDDSREEASAEANQALCERFGATYIGRQQQRAFLKSLARTAGVDPTTVDWLAGARDSKVFTGGRALNLIALLFAGSRYALLDDDYVYSALQARDAVPDQLVLAADGGTTLRFANRSDQLASLGDDAATDVLAQHRDLVGQSLSTVLGDERFASVGVADTVVADCRHMRAQSRVLLTHQGVWRHSRSDQPFWLYVLKGRSREEFASDRDAYMQHRSRPVILQTARRWALHRSPRFLPLAVDGSAWLPPTLPEGRAEDLLFNALLLALHPGGQALEAPYAFEHGREDQHTYSDRQRQAAMTPGLATLLADFIDARVEQCEAESPVARFDWLLTQLNDLCAASPQRRAQFIREYLGWVRGDFIGQLQAQASDWQNLPVHWQADAQAMIKANARALLQSDALRLNDTPDNCPDEQAVDDTFARLRQWLEAARHWPVLWQVACDQGDIEQRLKAR